MKIRTTLAVAGMILSAAAFAQIPQQQRNLNFGVSGGNINDRSRLVCCSGTLGALLQGSNGKQYVLSNSHVIGLLGNATPGQQITQPGLIDVGCDSSQTTVVADFTAATDLGTSNVDAAVAELRPGTMNETGAIEGVGIPSSVTMNPSVGMNVQKSGRTTGYTTGTITSISTDVNVRYNRRCALLTRPVTFAFTEQVIVGQPGFSSGGDSGSLILNMTKNPVALLYAGSSTATIGNPVGEMLAQMSAVAGTTLSFVGTAGPSSLPSLGLRDQDQALRVKREIAREWLSREGVLGIGVGASANDPNEAAIVIYTERGRAVALPEFLQGIRVRRIVSDAFEAFNGGCCSSCAK